MTETNNMSYCMTCGVPYLLQINDTYVCGDCNKRNIEKYKRLEQTKTVCSCAKQHVITDYNECDECARGFCDNLIVRYIEYLPSGYGAGGMICRSCIPDYLKTLPQGHRATTARGTPLRYLVC